VVEHRGASALGRPVRRQLAPGAWRRTRRITYLASQCAFADIAQSFDTSAHSKACLTWVHRTSACITAGHYDLVIMVNRISVNAIGMVAREPMVAAVAAMRDTSITLADPTDYICEPMKMPGRRGLRTRVL
jgi:hypothetical protein